MVNFPVNTPTPDKPSLPRFGNGEPVVDAPVLSNREKILSSTLTGLSYPLELNGNGGLSLSYNSDRIEQQILEILDTNLTERVLRIEFGTNDYLFDTISEAVLENQIQSILNKYIKNTDIKVKASINDEGVCDLKIFYSYLGGLDGLVRYNYSAPDYERK